MNKTCKVAIITGAGAKSASERNSLAMAAEGAKVVVNDIAINQDGTRGADRVVDLISKPMVARPHYDNVSTMNGRAISKPLFVISPIDILSISCELIMNIVDHTEEIDSIMDVQLKGTFVYPGS
jgi:hypothetical protein